MSDPRPASTASARSGSTPEPGTGQTRHGTTPPGAPFPLAAAGAVAVPGGLPEGEAAAPSGGPGPAAPGGLVTRAISVRSPAPGSEPSLWEQCGPRAPRFPTPDLIGHAADLVPRTPTPTHAPTGEGPQGIVEGPQWQIVIAPGLVRVQTRDYRSAERTHERNVRGHEVEVDAFVGWAAEQRDAGLVPDGECPRYPDPHPRAPITEWSPKSQRRMEEVCASLDYAALFTRYAQCQAMTGKGRRCGEVYDPEGTRCPACGASDPVVYDKRDRLPAILTTTYPGDWLPVAPSGEQVKKQLASLAKRFERDWSEPLVCLWKLEFQTRGAPHFHLFTNPPPGRVTVKVSAKTRAALADPDTRGKLVGSGDVTPAPGGACEATVNLRGWLSVAWAEIVDHPDPEQYRRHLRAGTGVDREKAMDATDPRRVVSYFKAYTAKKDKSYQNRPPRQWTEGYLICDGCSESYLGDLGECPECSCREATFVDPSGGPGRFWSYRGLTVARTTVDVDPDVGIRAGRILRRWHRAELRKRSDAAAGQAAKEVRDQGGSTDEAAAAARAARARTLTRPTRRPRYRGGERIDTGDHHQDPIQGLAGAELAAAYAPTYRRTRVRRRALPANRGRALVNDGAGFTAQLARALTGEQPTAEQRRERLRATRTVTARRRDGTTADRLAVVTA